MGQCAPTDKRLSLELGGNAPFIVFDDAGLDAAAESAVAFRFRNGQQACFCANRIMVQVGIHDAFAARVAKRVVALRASPGTAADSHIGPIINCAALDKITAHVADAAAKGDDLRRPASLRDRG